jgi:ferredoxin
MDARPVSPALPAAAPQEPDRWRVTINDSCVGTGICAGIARSHFRLGTDDRSRPVAEEVEPSELLLDAAASCPMEAIRVTNARTGAVVEL